MHPIFPELMASTSQWTDVVLGFLNRLGSLCVLFPEETPMDMKAADAFQLAPLLQTLHVVGNGEIMPGLFQVSRPLVTNDYLHFVFSRPTNLKFLRRCAMGGSGNTWRLLDFLRLTSRLTAPTLQAQGLTEDFMSTLVIHENGEMFISRFVTGAAEDEDSGKGQDPVLCARLWIAGGRSMAGVHDLSLYVVFSPDLRPEHPVL
ncbi:hypothetical protein DFS33DRAFT_1274132 [Desarmillaria ectypa]|nr:hypothetical protein DFS33DRAFT_1274132 [Desarmillaria ectypa]